MKVLLVNKFYYLSGGAERYVRLWEAVLRARGHEVIPFAMRDPRNWPTPYGRYFTRPIRFDTGASLRARFSAGLRSVYSLDAARRIRRLIREARPDIAHLHSYCYQLTPSILAPLREAGIPVFQTAHEYKHICANQRLLNEGTGAICEACRTGRWYAPVAARCIKGSLGASVIGCVEQLADRFLRLSRQVIRRIITPSDFMRRKMLAFGMDGSRIVHVPNFVVANEFDPSRPPGDYFLFMGRLVRHKGIMTLLAAAEKLRDVPVRVAGDGPLENEVRETVAQDNLRNVQLLGFMDGSPLRAQIEAARAVVVPSEWYENCPFVVLEAMAAGRPVIAARIGGIPELVADGETGILHAPGSVSSLVESMHRLWQDRVSAESMGAAGRRRVEECYGAESHYRAMMKVFTA